jgi:CrcB protein
VVGAECRFGISVMWPQSAGGFPWATFLINVSGCVLIGVLMVLIAEVWSAHRLLRPFLGVGVLGGYTTFSTYVLDVQQLVTAGAARTALLYLIGTPLAAVAAASAGMFITRAGVVAGRPRRREQG